MSFRRKYWNYFLPTSVGLHTKIISQLRVNVNIFILLLLL